MASLAVSIQTGSDTAGINVGQGAAASVHHPTDVAVDGFLAKVASAPATQEASSCSAHLAKGTSTTKPFSEVTEHDRPSRARGAPCIRSRSGPISAPGKGASCEQSSVIRHAPASDRGSRPCAGVSIARCCRKAKYKQNREYTTTARGSKSTRLKEQDPPNHPSQQPTNPIPHPHRPG